MTSVTVAQRCHVDFSYLINGTAPTELNVVGEQASQAQGKLKGQFGCENWW